MSAGEDANSLFRFMKKWSCDCCVRHSIQARTHKGKLSNFTQLLYVWSLGAGLPRADATCESISNCPVRFWLNGFHSKWLKLVKMKYSMWTDQKLTHNLFCSNRVFGSNFSWNECRFCVEGFMYKTHEIQSALFKLSQRGKPFKQPVMCFCRDYKPQTTGLSNSDCGWLQPDWCCPLTSNVSK